MTNAVPSDLLADTPLRRELAAAILPHVVDAHALEHIGGYLGRSVVFGCGDLVVKCFFHSAESKWKREVRAHTFLADAGLPVPRIVASGTLSAGVPWLLVTRLPGTIGNDAVAGLTASERIAVFASAGTLLAQLHSLPVDERLTEEPLAAAREDYWHKVGKRLGEYGASPKASTYRVESLDRARGWARDLLRFLPSDLVCVHGDFSTRNLLLQRGGDGAWSVSGLIDFERAEYGDATVDLVRMLIQHPDWNEPAFTAFLDAYAAAVAVPCRERVLLQLSGIVLDASTWAGEKDRAYYDRLLNITDRVASSPESLPAVFRPSRSGEARDELRLSLPSHLKADLQAILDVEPGQESALEVQVSVEESAERGRPEVGLRIAGPLAHALREVIEQGFQIRPNVPQKMVDAHLSLLTAALKEVTPPTYEAKLGAGKVVIATHDVEAVRHFLAPAVSIEPTKPSKDHPVVPDLVDAPSRWLLPVAEDVWGSFAETTWSRVFGHPPVRSRSEGVVAFDTGKVVLVRDRMARLRNGAPIFHVSEKEGRAYFVLYDDALSCNRHIFARTVRSRLSLAAGRGFHASAVALPDGRAILFCGPSGAGKTTHALSCVAQLPGARLVSNDRIFLSESDGVVYVHGSPQSVGIRRGTLDLVRAVGQVAADPEQLVGTHGASTGLNHSRSLEDFEKRDHRDLATFLSPSEAARLLGSEVAPIAPLAAIALLDLGAGEPIWHREPSMSASSVLREHAHPLADNQHPFWDDLIASPASSSSLPGLATIPVWSLRSRHHLDRVWRELPSSLQ